jgi:hypothetical protein
MNSAEGRVQLVIHFLVARSFHDSPQKIEARNNEPRVNNGIN